MFFCNLVCLAQLACLLSSNICIKGVAFIHTLALDFSGVIGSILTCLTFPCETVLLVGNGLFRRCCDRKSRAACAQSFTVWQQATIEITCHDHSIIACSRHIYTGVVLRASRSWWITHSTQHQRRGCNNTCIDSHRFTASRPTPTGSSQIFWRDQCAP